MQGLYNSLVQRTTLASTAGQNCYTKLTTFYNEGHIPILSDSHNLRIRCYMDTLANIVSQSTGSATAAATINYTNVILMVIKIPSDIEYRKPSLTQEHARDVREATLGLSPLDPVNLGSNHEPLAASMVLNH